MLIHNHINAFTDGSLRPGAGGHDTGWRPFESFVLQCCTIEFTSALHKPCIRIAPRCYETSGSCLQPPYERNTLPTGGVVEIDNESVSLTAYYFKICIKCRRTGLYMCATAWLYDHCQSVRYCLSKFEHSMHSTHYELKSSSSSVHTYQLEGWHTGMATLSSFVHT